MAKPVKALIEEFKGNYDQEINWGEPMPDDKRFPMKDEVNHPEHYASGGIECLKAMEAMATQVQDMKVKLSGHDYYLWQVIFKYVWRFPYKESPVKDLKKAQFYLNNLIKNLEKKDNAN